MPKWLDTLAGAPSCPGLRLNSQSGQYARSDGRQEQGESGARFGRARQAAMAVTHRDLQRRSVPTLSWALEHAMLEPAGHTRSQHVTGRLEGHIRVVVRADFGVAVLAEVGEAQRGAFRGGSKNAEMRHKDCSSPGPVIWWHLDE